MNAQHTPGPWEEASDGRIYAQPVPRSGGVADARVIATLTPNHAITATEMVGNARLIVAAPDLYAALVEAHALLARDYPKPSRNAGYWPTLREPFERIEAAISAAKGKP